MIYIAGSSAEIERAEKWAAAVRGLGVEVTSTWPENIRRVQREKAMQSTHEAANPREATLRERQGWAKQNVAEVYRAHTLWLLVPTAGLTSQGAYYELAVANENGKRTIGSGGDQRFIFAALAWQLYATDEEAFEAIRMIYRSSIGL